MVPNDNLTDARRSVKWMAIIGKLSLIVLVITLANISVSYLIDNLGIQIWPEYLEIVDRAVLLGVLLYICLMAMPFLPGVEIGLTLMIVLGPKGVAIIYVCTIIALVIGFGLGRIIPAKLLISLLEWLHLKHAANLLREFNGVPPEKRLEYLSQRASMKFVPSLLKYRYIVLAVLFNLPGNALIGGGGGIAMMAGMSRLYSFSVYCLAVSLAILPVPMFFFLSKLL